MLKAMSIVAAGTLPRERFASTIPAKDVFVDARKIGTARTWTDAHAVAAPHILGRVIVEISEGPNGFFITTRAS